MTPEAARGHIRSLTAPPRDHIAYFERVAASRKYVVFFGAGAVFANGIVDAWNTWISHPADFVCDRDPAKWGRLVSGVPCIGPDDLFRMKNDCSVFLSLGAVGEALDFLSARGILAMPFYKYDIKYTSRLSPDRLENDSIRLAECYASLYDDISRNVFDVSVERIFRGLDDAGRMASVYSPDQYFPDDIIRLSPQEAFVDAGAFDGDTLRDFIRRVDGRFDAYYAFELSRANYRTLREAIDGIADNGRVQAFEVGLGDAEENVAYREFQSGSAIGRGDCEGRIDTIDRILAGKRVTFIKMDIEGYEPKALRGAARTITEQKPVVAACVYHEPAHLWEIPLYLKSLVPGYRIYLRHHSALEYETVCYAVPGE